MWVKRGKQQVVIFIDPKGLEHTKGLDNEKIQFAKKIKVIEKKLNVGNLKLESYVISSTNYADLVVGMVTYP